jgi:hypothetical protein
VLLFVGDTGDELRVLLDLLSHDPALFALVIFQIGYPAFCLG